MKRMARQIINHQLNAVDATPVEFIKMTAANGCNLVTLFVFDGRQVLPSLTQTPLTFPTVVTRDTKRAVLDALAETGVSVNGIEFFPLTDDVDLNVYKPALALGRELGAKRVSSHIFIRDDALVVDKLGALCELAKAEGLVVSSEFCPMTAGNPSLERGKWLVDQVGSSHFGIGVDTLHVVRSGAAIADIAKLDERYFGISQINDAFGREVSSNYIDSVHNREVPGTGELPLREILNAVPASLPIEIEVPAQHRRKAGVTAAEHVRDCIAGTRAILETLSPSR
jgi:sugar phosphate isomerase/epimerase